MRKRPVIAALWMGHHVAQNAVGFTKCLGCGHNGHVVNVAQPQLVPTMSNVQYVGIVVQIEDHGEGVTLANSIVEGEPVCVIVELELCLAECQHVTDKDHIHFWDLLLSQVMQQLFHDSIREGTFDIEEECRDNLLVMPGGLDSVVKGLLLM